jgi:hypothetical protein
MSNAYNQNNMNNDTTPPNDQTDSATRPLDPLNTEPAGSIEPQPSHAFDRDFDTDIEEASTPASTPTEAAPTESSSVTEPTPRNEFDRDFDTDLENTDVSEPPIVEPVLPTTIRIDLTFIDPLGQGIKGLNYNIKVGDTPHEGLTDSEGRAAPLDNVEPGVDLEILVKKDNGTWTTKYKGQTACSDMTICAKSPHIKLTVKTEEHQGEAQKPTPPKPAAPKPAEVKPPLPRAGEIPKTAPPSTAPKAISGRNEKGHPVTSFEAVKDWAGRNLVPTWFHDLLYKDYKAARKQEDAKTGADKAKAKPQASASTAAATKGSTPAPATAGITSLDQKPPKAVTELIAIMEEQVGWEWNTLGGSETVVTQLATGKLKVSDIPLKNPSQYRSVCYKSVRVGLKRATLVNDFKNAKEYGSQGGDWLLTQGFINVTKDLPDPRWAAPGDVIVYKWTKETHAKRQAKKDLPIQKLNEKDLKQWEAAHAAWEKQVAALKEKGSTQLPKEPVKPTPRALTPISNFGHIDVRSYDGYLSDFKRQTFPSSTEYDVIGVYRKIYDPLPDIRVRAFLKILREWENHGIPDDAKRYYALYKTGKNQEYFTDMSKHPYEDSGKDAPAGAYQIRLSTYKRLIKKDFGVGPGFSQAQQDRLAVLLIELYTPAKYKTGDILTLVRTGKIAEAIRVLNVDQWASLPGNAQSNKINKTTGKVFTIDEVVSYHKEIMMEMLKK